MTRFRFFVQCYCVTLFLAGFWIGLLNHYLTVQLIPLLNLDLLKNVCFYDCRILANRLMLFEEKLCTFANNLFHIKMSLYISNRAVVLPIILEQKMSHLLICDRV